MDRATFLRYIEQISVWSRGAERAPHKPLLLLLALAELQRGHDNLPYKEVEAPLKRLLEEFGPSRGRYHPEFPFWFLQTDGLWTIPGSHTIAPRTGKKNPSAGELRKQDATGGFPAEVLQLLKNHPELMDEAARRVLEAHFPETLHRDILDQVGLVLGSRTDSRSRRPRDPAFRPKVLLAYSYRCALCDLDLRLDGVTIGVEAAHIMWHQANGPDTEANGLGLCSLHHKIFDLGGYTVDHDHRVLISSRITGNETIQAVLLRFHGKRLNLPEDPSLQPAPQFLDWHRKEVFKPEVRYLGTSAPK